MKISESNSWKLLLSRKLRHFRRSRKPFLSMLYAINLSPLLVTKHTVTKWGFTLNIVHLLKNFNLKNILIVFVFFFFVFFWGGQHFLISRMLLLTRELHMAYPLDMSGNRNCPPLIWLIEFVHLDGLVFQIGSEKLILELLNC